MVPEISRLKDTTKSQEKRLSLYLVSTTKAKLGGYRTPSEVTRNPLILELRDCYHWICRQILPENAGLTFLLAQN